MQRTVTVKFVGETSLNPNHPYQVVKVKNSTEFDPGTYLSKKDVDAVLGRPRWDVVIVGSAE